MTTIILRVQPANPAEIHQDFQGNQEGNRIREDQFAGQCRYGHARQLLGPDLSG